MTFEEKIIENGDKNGRLSIWETIKSTVRFVLKEMPLYLLLFLCLMCLMDYLGVYFKGSKFLKAEESMKIIGSLNSTIASAVGIIVSTAFIVKFFSLARGEKQTKSYGKKVLHVIWKQALLGFLVAIPLILIMLLVGLLGPLSVILSMIVSIFCIFYISPISSAIAYDPLRPFSISIEQGHSTLSGNFRDYARSILGIFAFLFVIDFLLDFIIEQLVKGNPNLGDATWIVRTIITNIVSLISTTSLASVYLYYARENQAMFKQDEEHEDKEAFLNKLKSEDTPVSYPSEAADENKGKESLEQDE